MEEGRMKGWIGGKQGRIEEADKEFDEEGEEGHRKFICGEKEGGEEFGGKDIITDGLKRRGTLGISYYSKHILNTTQTHRQIESLGARHEKNGKKTEAARGDRKFTVKVTVYFTLTVMWLSSCFNSICRNFLCEDLCLLVLSYLWLPENGSESAAGLSEPPPTSPFISLACRKQPARGIQAA